MAVIVFFATLSCPGAIICPRYSISLWKKKDFLAVVVLKGLSVYRHGQGGIVIREVVAVNQGFSTGPVEQLLGGGGSDSNHHMLRKVLRTSGEVGDINPEGLFS